MSDLKQQATKAFLWDFSGRLAQHGMSFIVSIFLARLLEPSDFGLIAMVMVIVGLASIFVDIGLGAALIQRKRLHQIHYSSVFYFNVFLGTLLSLITYFLAASISNFYNTPALLPIIEAMSPLFVINALNSVQIIRFQRELNYALFTKLSIAASLSSGFIGVFMAYKGFGVWSLVTQILSLGVISVILIWKNSKWIPRLEFSWKALKQLWGFGFRMFLSAVISSISDRLDYLIIGKIFTPTTLGYFQRAKSLDNMIIQYSSGSLMRVLFPVLSKLQHDLKRLQSVVMHVLRMIIFIIFFVLGCLFITSQDIIVLLFTQRWLPSAKYFEILVLCSFAYPISSLLVNILASRGNSKIFLKLEVYKRIIYLLNFFILYQWGILAYLYGLVLVSFFSVLLNMFFAAREMNVVFMKFLYPILIQITITFFTTQITLIIIQKLVYALSIMLIIKLVIFSLLYLGCNHLFQIKSYLTTMSELKKFLQKLKK
ncbi:MAG: lipopolysaccharide biosynthesis protein [Ignavibacteriae bacterium]|nr:lipopolysaccharide biosynthesis protein [Ignavibacteriota bacterium]